MRLNMTLKGLRGFTLIEVMITVAIVGILAAIAYPSYQEYIRKSNRSEAKVALTEGAQALERYYSINGRYVTTAGGTTLPAVFPTAVPTSGTAYYNITGTGTGNTFTLTATVTGTMVADDCGNYGISQTGALTSTSTIDKCL